LLTTVAFLKKDDDKAFYGFILLSGSLSIIDLIKMMIYLSSSWH
jgi:hypothetical protein